VSDDAATDRILLACGDLLASIAREHDLRAALVTTTERHELQHAIDGPRPPRSSWLKDALALRPRNERDVVSRELDAYLAQATAPDPSPRLTIVRLVRMAHVGRRGAEHEVALLALEVLGGEAQVVRLETLPCGSERARRGGSSRAARCRPCSSNLKGASYLAVGGMTT
jgi:hypothetical protein